MRKRWYIDEHMRQVREGDRSPASRSPEAGGARRLALWNRRIGMPPMGPPAEDRLWRALRKAASLFNAPFRCVNDSVLILHPLAAPIEAHAFEAENGVLTLIAWHRTALPGEAGQGTEVPPVLPVRFLNADQWLTIPLGRERMTVMNLDTRKVLGR